MRAKKRAASSLSGAGTIMLSSTMPISHFLLVVFHKWVLVRPPGSGGSGCAKTDQVNGALSFPPPRPSPARGEGKIQLSLNKLPPAPRRGRAGVGAIRRTLLEIESNLALELDQLGRHSLARHAQPAERDRQGEAPRTGAAGIDEQHAVLFPATRLVRMTGDDGPEPGSGRIEIELGDIVDDEDDGIADLQHRRVGQRRRPFASVDIAAHRGDRRQAG